MAQMKPDNPKRAFTRAMRRLCGRSGIAPVAAAAFIVLAACIGFVVMAGAPSGVELTRSSQGELQKSGQQSAGQEPTSSNAEPEPTAPTPLYVHVDGAVSSPGVYAIDEGSRVNDAVMAAGGLVEGADTTSLNLAAPVQDGSKVYVPSFGESQGSPDSTGSVADGYQLTSVVGSTGNSTGSHLVNINSATADELKTLPGVGDATAEAILEDRQSNGPFASIEDLMRVSGIGDKKFAKLREKICV